MANTVIVSGKEGYLIDKTTFEALVQRICDLENTVRNGSTIVPIADSVDAIRTGEIGISDDYARADHKHPIVRQSNPGDPTLTYVWSTGSSLISETILDRWSTEEWYAYKFRVHGEYAGGLGWSYITIPSIAGFQQPLIYEIGTYRNQSISVQEDGPQGNGGDGASPRGPYMGKEAHHWSSTNRIYHGYNRRDTTYIMFTEFIVKYIRA